MGKQKKSAIKAKASKIAGEAQKSGKYQANGKFMYILRIILGIAYDVWQIAKGHPVGVIHLSQDQAADLKINGEKMHHDEVKDLTSNTDVIHNHPNGVSFFAIEKPEGEFTKLMI